MNTNSFPRRALRSHVSSLTLKLLSVYGACMLGACAAPSQPGPAPSEQLWQQIEAEVGDAACQSSTQCVSAAVGDKPCGGPERYVAWSSARSDRARLESLLAEHRAARRAENIKSGMASNCVFVTDPGAQCVNKRCTLREAGNGAGAAGRTD